MALRHRQWRPRRSPRSATRWSHGRICRRRSRQCFASSAAGGRVPVAVAVAARRARILPLPRLSCCADGSTARSLAGIATPPRTRTRRTYGASRSRRSSTWSIWSTASLRGRTDLTGPFFPSAGCRSITCWRLEDWATCRRRLASGTPRGRRGKGARERRVRSC